MNLNDCKEILNRLEAKKSVLSDDICNLKIDIKSNKDLYESTLQAQAILQKVAQETQTEITFHLSNIITLALNSVFDDDYEFKIDFVERRNKTEADMYLLKEGQRMNPMSDNGGGVVDVITFALRVALWNIVKNRNTIILDEPFRFLSRELQNKAGIMLKNLSEKLNLQFIIISHDKALIEAADKNFSVRIKNKVSEVINE